MSVTARKDGQLYKPGCPSGPVSLHLWAKTAAGWRYVCVVYGVE